MSIYYLKIDKKMIFSAAKLKKCLNNKKKHCFT